MYLYLRSGFRIALSQLRCGCTGPIPILVARRSHTFIPHRTVAFPPQTRSQLEVVLDPLQRYPCGIPESWDSLITLAGSR